MMVPRIKFGWGNNRGAASGQNSVVLQEAVCYRLPLIGMADSIVRAVQKLYIIVLQVLSRYIHLSQLNITTCNFKSILSSQHLLARAIASHEL